MTELTALLQELHPEVDVKNCDRLVDDGILDSFGIITIVSEIHARWNVVIPAEEILPENFNSVEDLHGLICRLSDGT